MCILLIKKFDIELVKKTFVCNVQPETLLVFIFPHCLGVDKYPSYQPDSVWYEFPLLVRFKTEWGICINMSQCRQIQSSRAGRWAEARNIAHRRFISLNSDVALSTILTEPCQRAVSRVRELTLIFTWGKWLVFTFRTHGWFSGCTVLFMPKCMCSLQLWGCQVSVQGGVLQQRLDHSITWGKKLMDRKSALNKETLYFVFPVKCNMI